MMKDRKDYTGEELLDLPEEDVVYSKAIQGTLAVVSMLDLTEGIEIQVKETSRFIFVTSLINGKPYRSLKMKHKRILKTRPIDLFDTFNSRLLPKKEE